MDPTATTTMTPDLGMSAELTAGNHRFVAHEESHKPETVRISKTQRRQRDWASFTPKLARTSSDVDRKRKKVARRNKRIGRMRSKK